MSAVRHAVSLCLALVLAIAHLEPAEAGDVPVLLAQAQSDRPNLFRSLFGIGRRTKQRQEAGAVRREYRTVAQPRRQKVRSKPPARRRQNAETRHASLQRSQEHRPARRRAGKRKSPKATSRVAASGTFRTLCVRTCDGYYFPISFSTTRDRFTNDEMACKAMCSGADAELYYHEAKLLADPEMDTASVMMSVKEEPYAKLPAAFSYRLRLDESCTCSRPRGQQFAAAGSTAETKQATAYFASTFGIVRVPVPRPDLSEGSTTLANRDGGFVEHSSGQELLISSADLPSERPVRVIYPAYGAQSDMGLALLGPVSK